MKNAKFLLFFTLPLISLIFYSCKSLPREPQPLYELSRNLNDKGQMSAAQLASLFIAHNPDADYQEIKDFAQLYIDEAGMEGINSDIAFSQMCLETGFLRFGNLVQPEWHNYCGLGALGPEQPGERFETKELGVRAHIQHLQAYSTTEEVKLKNELVDPRYNWVHKTKLVTDIFGLTGTWATDPNYAAKIERLLQELERQY